MMGMLGCYLPDECGRVADDEDVVGDSLHFRDELGGHLVLLATGDGIESALVDGVVEVLVGEVHAGGVHDEVGQVVVLLECSFLHLLDDRFRDVDGRDVRVAVLEHLLRQLRVPAAHHQDLVLLLHSQLQEVLLQLRVLGVPVEHSLVLLVPVVPEVGLGVLFPRVDAFWLRRFLGLGLWLGLLLLLLLLVAPLLEEHLEVELLLLAELVHE